jgi:sirohydrochlorin ferrochelatase
MSRAETSSGVQMSRPESAESSAVVLLSHGSRDARAEYVAAELVSAVAAATGVTVRAAHLDFTAPNPVVALRALAADGFGSVRVVPLLFTPGYHVSHDVPSAVRASGVTGQMGITVAPPLLCGSGHERDLLLRALADRLAQAGAGVTGLAHAAAAPDVDGLVLASAGSGSAPARQRVESLARALARARGIPVISAYAAASTPSLSRALEALSDMGIQRPAVASLFVAPGKLTDSVVAACRDLPVADPLGVSPAFVELLVAKARVLTRAI